MGARTISSVRVSTEMRKSVDELDLIRDYALFLKKAIFTITISSQKADSDGLLQAQERGEVQLITLEDLYR